VSTFNNHPARMANGPDWERKLSILNHRGWDEQILTDYAQIIGRRLGGAWSVDFAQDSMGKWWMLDMALAYNSFHPSHEE
jgi:hypothetical protein